MEGLVQVVQRLSLTKRLDEVQEIVRHAARDLTGADGATFVLRDGPRCFYADEDAIAPLWKGNRFPLGSCISGWSMLNRKAAVIPDIYEDERIPHEAYRPTFVKSLAMVPIRQLKPIGAIGNYWAEPHQPTEAEVGLLQALADTTAVAMESIGIRELSLTDDLTGLNNRRAFFHHAGEAIEAARAAGSPSTVVFADVDGLKQVNDEHGHDAGDELIQGAGSALASAMGPDDYVARLGGDEFVAYCSRELDPAAQRALLADVSVSVGVAVSTDSSRSIDELVNAADADMYRHKRSRASRRAPAPARRSP
jgi:GGDEF domain-containing protein